jgi:hypothetical protein
MIFFYPVVFWCVFGSWLSMNRGFAVTLKHTTLGRTPERVITPTQRPLAYNTQHSQQTDVHFRRGVQFRSISKRAAADLRLRLAATGIGPKRTYSSVIDKLLGRPRTRLEDTWHLFLLMLCELNCLVFDTACSGIYLILRRVRLSLSSGFWCRWQQVPRLFWPSFTNLHCITCQREIFMGW